MEPTGTPPDARTGHPAVPPAAERQSGFDEQREDIVALLGAAKKNADHELVRSAMASGGDVARIDGHANLEACLRRLGTIDGGSGSLGPALAVAQRAHTALVAGRADLQLAFRPGGSEAARLAYAAAACALWHVVTLLCAEAVTLAPPAGGRGGPLIRADRGGAARVGAMLPVARLRDFCDAAERHGFSQLVREGAADVERAATLLAEVFGTIAAGVTASVAAVLFLLWGARQLAEYYYNTRGQVSRWLDTQSAFLRANAQALGHGAPERAGQERWADRLATLAARVRVDADEAEHLARAPRVPERSPAPGPGGAAAAGMLV